MATSRIDPGKVGLRWLFLALALAALGPVVAADPSSDGRPARPRDPRRAALAGLPVQSLPAEQRQTVERCMRSGALYRRLPVDSVVCDAALLHFVLEKPETLVDLWRVLGISRLSLDPVGDGQWRLADGYGTVGTVRLLHHQRRGDRGMLVFLGRGGYSGPLSPRDLTGSCLVVVRHAPCGTGTDDRCRQAVQIDAFLDVDGLGLEIVTRMLQPLIVHSAATNLQEICLFVSRLAAAAERNPEGVARLTERMARTAPEDRRILAELAARGHAARASTTNAADVAAELAARWLPADEVAETRRR